MQTGNRLAWRGTLAAAAALILLSPSWLAGRVAAADAKQPAQKPAAKLDLNTATLAQLQDLPGIGEVYSQKIVDGRPYKSVKDLAKLGLPAPTLAKITPLVMVTPAKKPPKKGMVWVNTDSKIYHKEGSPWYGKTKEGTWMTEPDAIKAGNKAAQ